MSISEHRNHKVFIKVFDRDTNPYGLRCSDCFCHIKWASKQEYAEHKFLQKEIKMDGVSTFDLLFSYETL